MTEANTEKDVKPTRRFSSEPTREQRIEWSVSAGFTQAEAEQIESEFDETLARWNQRQKNGDGLDDEATRRVVHGMTDEQFTGSPGYK